MSRLYYQFVVSITEEERARGGGGGWLHPHIESLQPLWSGNFSWYRFHCFRFILKFAHRLTRTTIGYGWQRQGLYQSQRTKKYVFISYTM